jgi:HK97 family phage portal protein
MMNPIAWLKSLRLASRAAAADVYPHQRALGIGADWSPTTYGEYYARSVPIYSAIRVRADTVTRPPMTLHTASASPATPPLPPHHPLARLFQRPTPHHTFADLLRATETYLCLWGKAYWAIEIKDGRQEIWPIRPDRLVPRPGTGTNYIASYLYRAATGQELVYLPEQIVTFLYFNPMDERAGMSPIAPLRMTADTAYDSMKYNRNTLRNGGTPDVLLLGEQDMTTKEVEDFYARWEKRFQGPDKAHRPAIVSSIKDVKTLGFSQREMEWLEGLRWSLEEVSRVYGVPQPFLGSLREATLANVETLERIFWRTTMIPEINFVQERITHDALPKLGYPAIRAAFDLTKIDVLTEQEEPRLKREEAYLIAGVLSINEVRESRGLQPIPGGDDRDAPARRRNPPRPMSTAAAQAGSQAREARNGDHPSDGPAPSPAHLETLLRP